MFSLGADFRFAVRTWRHEPWSAAALVLTLALGIGTATATYAIFNQVLFRPVPGLADPSSLVMVRLQPVDHSRNYSSFAHAHLVEMRQAETGLLGLTSADHSSGWISPNASGESVRVDLEGVCRGFFRVMGLRMRLGRPLGDDEVETPGQRVAVISEALWVKQFAGSTDVIGRALYLNNERFTVVGVVERYRGWSLIAKNDLWIPAAEWSVVDRRTGADPFDDGHFELIGRLAPGSTVASVERQLAGVFTRVDEARGKVRPKTLAPVVTQGLSTINQKTLVTRLSGIFTILASGSLLLLLLACANAANLALVRVTGRRRELAVRLALGASRSRLMRQLCIESVGLASIAWSLGLILAALLVDLFRGTRFLPYIPGIDELGFDWRVLAVSAAASLVTVVACGVLPAWPATSIDPRKTLQEGRGVTRVHHRARAVLVAVQFAVSLALIVSAGVLFRSLENLRTQDLGFSPANVVGFDLNPAERGYTSARRDQLVMDVMNRLGDTAGFTDIAYSSPAPISTSYSQMQLKAADRPTAADVRAVSVVVSPRYFETLNISLVRGRSFTNTEFLRAPGPSSQPVVLSASLARELFGAEAAVGRQLEVAGERSNRAEVIGVVGDVKSGDLRGEPRLTIYKPSGQTFVYGTFLIRSPLPTEEIVARTRSVMHELAPTLPIDEVGTLSADIESMLTEERVLMRLMAIVAIMAGVLALGGLYAVIAYLVKERTRELGIRLALGASSRSIVSLVLGRVAWMCGAGAIAGVGMVLVSSQVLASRVFHVSAADPMTILLAMGLLGAAGLGAAWLPARRAARINPTIALRSE